MTLKEFVLSLLRNFLACFRKKNYPFKELENRQSSEISNDLKSQESELLKMQEEDDKILSYGRTVKTKLYSLEQDITVFEHELPKDFKRFSEEISSLRDLYNSNLEEYNNRSMLNFSIHPGMDNDLLVLVYKLEQKVRKFIDKDVKFSILSKRLERFICKLNILYNISIFNVDEAEKINNQLDIAMETELKQVDELKKCDAVLREHDFLERMTNLFSYSDYLIFKAKLRNSSSLPRELSYNIVVRTKFSNIDYIKAFKDFVLDEISDLIELLPLLKDKNTADRFKKSLQKLLEKLTYGEVEKLLFSNDDTYWKQFLDEEINLLHTLEMDGAPKEKIKVRMLDRLEIKVKEEDVLSFPKTDTIMALTNLLVTTHDGRIQLLIQVLRNVSNEITYKEIYHLVILFEAMAVLEKNENELIGNLEKYIKKYSYSSSAIKAKKIGVKNSINKAYIPIFKLDEYKADMLNILRELNFDFKVRDDVVYFNDAYFSDMKNLKFELYS